MYIPIFFSQHFVSMVSSNFVSFNFTYPASRDYLYSFFTVQINFPRKYPSIFCICPFCLHLQVNVCQRSIPGKLALAPRIVFRDQLRGGGIPNFFFPFSTFFAKFRASKGVGAPLTAPLNTPLLAPIFINFLYRKCLHFY